MSVRAFEIRIATHWIAFDADGYSRADCFASASRACV